MPRAALGAPLVPPPPPPPPRPRLPPPVLRMPRRTTYPSMRAEAQPLLHARPSSMMHARQPGVFYAQRVVPPPLHAGFHATPHAPRGVLVALDPVDGGVDHDRAPPPPQTLGLDHDRAPPRSQTHPAAASFVPLPAAQDALAPALVVDAEPSTSGNGAGAQDEGKQEGKDTIAEYDDE